MTHPTNIRRKQFHKEVEQELDVPLQLLLPVESFSPFGIELFLNNLVDRIVTIKGIMLKYLQKKGFALRIHLYCN